ncbi:integrase arm-type DNA-binding domain-containing protein [bacterium]|nr:integrase arm-type DNA-binding domain-containing protein [bacterium]
MSLTDIQVKTAKPKDNPKKPGEKITDRLFDGGGLYLEVSPTGGKWWRYKYRFDGKEKRLSLGVYPDVTLKEAREKHIEARKLRSNGVDPLQNRYAMKAARAEKSANTFEVIAREYFSKPSGRCSEAHQKNIVRRLEIDIFPWIGSRPISEVTTPELSVVLRKVENRGALETAHRLLQNCEQVFRYAIQTGRAERNPAPNLKGMLKPPKVKHYAALVEPNAVGQLLRAIDGYQGSFVTKCALRFAPLVFVRPGELRQAEWAEINFDTAEWNIPAERMKMKEAHLVPLSKQALDILREIYPVTGSGRYVFPGERTRTRPMSNNAVLAALRRMGFGKDEMCGHGFRAMAKTMLTQVLHVPGEYSEQQLAHKVSDPLGRAYNRATHLPERRKMMQQWADYLDKLRVSTQIVQLQKVP